MTAIEHAAAQAVQHARAEAGGWFRNDSNQETGMTTSQAAATPAPQRNVLADLSYVLGQLDSNRLVSYLFSSGHGKLLSAQEIDHVIGLVSAIEAGRQPSDTAAPANA